ncbi:hypothetical protein EV363DRAFT_1224244, partial [Boletus edulis]
QDSCRSSSPQYSYPPPPFLTHSTSHDIYTTEATSISHDAGGYAHVPGIYTDEQIKGWQKVGCSPFLQLWALGRTANIDFLEKKDPPSPYVSASSVPLTGKSKPPRPLTESEIQDYIAAYAKAAINVVNGAGFDGVEIHGANGYLPDQFLQTLSNIRTDRWGGDGGCRRGRPSWYSYQSLEHFTR